MSSIEVTKPAPESVVRTVEVKRPVEVGVPGAVGPRGPSGVYVSDTPPVDTTLIWVDTSA